MCERCAAYPFLLRFIEDVDDHVPGAVHHLGDLLVHALQHGQVAVGSDRLVDGDGGHALLPRVADGLLTTNWVQRQPPQNRRASTSPLQQPRVAGMTCVWRWTTETRDLGSLQLDPSLVRIDDDGSGLLRLATSVLCTWRPHRADQAALHPVNDPAQGGPGFASVDPARAACSGQHAHFAGALHVPSGAAAAACCQRPQAVCQRAQVVN